VLGSGAAIVPGHGARDHVGYAIRQLSGHVPTRVTYAHLGWRRADEHGWFYLHAGGAIGASGPIAGIDVQLSSTFERFRLPSPSTGADLAVAVQASLGLLSLAPDRIVVPLLAGVARVVAAPVDFSLHLAGPTGVGKSELAALVQQHFGAGLDRTHLPGHWSSTSNALETTAFTAKDCVLVVDDFVPTGAQHDRQRQQRDADRLLRGAGNRGGRARLAADLTMRPTRSPRGLILSSGEDTPFGQSLRARLLTIEVAPGDVNFDALTGHQRAAAAGVFAVALAGYIRWLAPALEERREAVRTEAARLRAIAAAVPGHRRTPGIIGDLAAGWGLLLAYACAIGAIDNATACGLWQRGWRALLEAATAQADDQAGGDPARHFIELLGAAIAAKLAHLAGPTDGGSPAINPGAWGWREVDRDSATFGAIHATWLPCGERAGWISGDDVYLEPTVSHAVATRLGERSGDGLPIGPATLRRRLWQAGLLATIDSDERHLTIRLMIEGRRRRVLHLAASRFAAVDERRQTADPIDGIGVPLSAFGAWPTWPTTDGPEGNAGAMHDSHNGRSPDGTDDRADAIHNATAGSASGVEEVGQVGHATQPREGR
jgi:hypothetical protein